MFCTEFLSLILLGTLVLKRGYCEPEGPNRIPLSQASDSPSNTDTLLTSFSSKLPRTSQVLKKWDNKLHAWGKRMDKFAYNTFIFPTSTEIDPREYLLEPEDGLITEKSSMYNTSEPLDITQEQAAVQQSTPHLLEQVRLQKLRELARSSHIEHNVIFGNNDITRSSLKRWSKEPMSWVKRFDAEPFSKRWTSGGMSAWGKRGQMEPLEKRWTSVAMSAWGKRNMAFTHADKELQIKHNSQVMPEDTKRAYRLMPNPAKRWGPNKITAWGKRSNDGSQDSLRYPRYINTRFDEIYSSPSGTQTIDSTSSNTRSFRRKREINEATLNALYENIRNRDEYEDIGKVGDISELDKRALWSPFKALNDWAKRTRWPNFDWPVKKWPRGNYWGKRDSIFDDERTDAKDLDLKYLNTLQADVERLIGKSKRTWKPIDVWG